MMRARDRAKSRDRVEVGDGPEMGCRRAVDGSEMGCRWAETGRRVEVGSLGGFQTAPTDRSLRQFTNIDTMDSSVIIIAA